jgi:SAM-dependent methyltransferase
MTALSPEGLTRAMRHDWDERARENARYYICTDLPADEQGFFASGSEDYDRLVRPFLAQQGLNPAQKVALEIGCGIGRMTWCFAQEFAEVIGLDISPEMIEKARSFHWPSARFMVGTGMDLDGIESESIHFVFSYIVLQHIPDRNIILNYIREIARVLRPGGLFRIHMYGAPYLQVGHTLLMGYVSQSPRLQRFGLRKLPFLRRHRAGTWIGHPISLLDIRRVLRTVPLEILSVTGRWTESMWVLGRKVSCTRSTEKHL